MSSLFEQFKYKFKYSNIVAQMIYINIIVFAATFLWEAFASLMQAQENLIFNWFSLPASFSVFIGKPWTLITYGFLHGSFWHILFNLLVLFYIGNLFLDFFSKRDFLIYYFLGILIGGLFYLFSYNYFPALKGSNATLVGASAGIMAIFIGITTKIPNYALHFRLIGAIKLWHLAVAFIIFDIIQIPMDNTGGHISHLGGVITGYALTTFAVPSSKSSSTSLFGDLFKKKKKSPLKTVYKSKKKMSATVDNKQQQKIDAILDKISKSGYDALTKEEKDFLFSLGKK